MRPIFGALLFTFIIFINEIETADRPSKNKKKDAQSALAILEYLNKIEEIDAKKKKGKEKEDAMSKEDEESRVFSRMLRRLEIGKSSRVEENEAAYGTSRATRRQLVPKLKRQPAPKSEPNPGRTSDKSNRLPTFKQAQARSGGTAYEPQMNRHRRFPEPAPNFGFDSLPLYQNTVSDVTGGMYMDNEGYRYPVPYPPPPSTGNYGHNNFLQPSGEILPNGSFSFSQSTQNHEQDPLLKSNGEIPSSGPYVQQQDFQDHQSRNYYPSESPGINRWNAYLNNKNKNRSENSSSGHNSSYQYQE